MRSCAIALACSILLFGSASANGTSRDGAWWGGFGSPPYPPGVNDRLQCATVYQGSLILGGMFTEASGVPAGFIAGWDGTGWFSLDGGVSSGTDVRAMIVYNGDLIAGGHFRGADHIPVNFIARWDGSAWHRMGDGLDGPVNALTIYNGQLIAGGGFSGRVAAWDGVTWTPFGSLILGEVLSLAGFDGDLIAGGYFTWIGGITVNGIARWNGASWAALGSGVSGGGQPGVLALALEGRDLVAGGRFTSAGGVPALNVARWTGSVWNKMGGADGTVRSLYAGTGGFYLGGGFSSPANGIARWDGTDWQPLDGGTDNDVTAILEWNDSLIAGGWFEHAGGVAANYVSAWDGLAWEPVGSAHEGAGLSGNYVSALLPFQGDLIVGGDFSTRVDIGRDVGRWNGASWQPIGTDHDPTLAFAAIHDSLYKGSFGEGVMRWDGTAWLNGGLSDAVDGLIVYHDALYAAGWRNVWRHEGMSWVSIGTFDDGIAALAVYGDRLIVGGAFTTVQVSVSARRIASFDGTSWQPMGLGLGGTEATVRALAVHDNALYVGGNFVAAGGLAASNIARWDGSWHPLGTGVDLPVYAVASFGGDLVAAGAFTHTGDQDANRIARWDGATWSPFGSGLSERVLALASYGGDLYVGGDFDMAGGLPSWHIARWIEGTADVAPIDEGHAVTLILANPYRTGAVMRVTGMGSVPNIDIYDLSGSLVRRLQGGDVVRWDGRTEGGSRAAAGVYFILARSRAGLDQKKILLIR